MCFTHANNSLLNNQQYTLYKAKNSKLKLRTEHTFLSFAFLFLSRLVDITYSVKEKKIKKEEEEDDGRCFLLHALTSVTFDFKTNRFYLFRVLPPVNQ